MLKKYLLLFIIFVLVFGCKKKVTHEGVLIQRNNLPFRAYAPNYAPERDIFLKTSIKDIKFPDGVRYYLIYPKDGQYQNFKNNLGKNVKVKGEETYYFSDVSISIQEDPDYVPPDNRPAYMGFDEYRLEEAKIVK